jgi:hypothetical protein
LDPASARAEPAVVTYQEVSSEEIHYSAVLEHWNYILYQDGSEELYDHSTDADEFFNLANDPAYRDFMDELRVHLPSRLVLGDVNLDGTVNLLDVDPFIDRLGNGVYQVEADMNQDGAINLLDIGPFIAVLGAG